MLRRLQIEDLKNSCPPETFKYTSTAEMPHEVSIIGQERALSALSFGLDMNSRGFNIYVLGEGGTGKNSTIKKLLSEKAPKRQTPEDWCYVYNFKDPDSPKALSLEAGKAVEFSKDIEQLIKSLRAEIPKVFESKDYDKQRGRLIEAFQKRQKELFQDIERETAENGFSIRKGQSSLIIVPVKNDGEPMTEEEFTNLEPETRKRIEQIGRSLQERLDDVMRLVRDEERALKEAFARLDKEMVLNATGQHFEALLNKYKANEKVAQYIKDVMDDVLSHLEDFRPSEEQPTPPIPFFRLPRNDAPLQRYMVNVLVNNSELKGAPVIFEKNPTYPNLCGRIEYRFQYGMAVTDFTMIKAGSLHKANGGYLIINILDLLKNLFSYDALKRALKNREIKIEDVWEQYRLVSSAVLKPEAIPLNVKVILTGGAFLYYLLYNLDEEFRELFKVKADFENSMPRNPETMALYGMFAASCQREEGLRPLKGEALCAIVESGSRLVGHKERLSTRFSELADLIREADYRATLEGAKEIARTHVEQAIKERIYRSNRIEQRIQELIEEGTLIIETEGSKVGQVNGLAVLDLGDYSFGKPSRITARAYPGKAGVINIERETKMSGKVHNKAVMIITSYLGSTFGLQTPLSLTAYIAFEQLYEMVEGDSATCAELYALLSSIANVPLRQSIAVTGSMDQNGEVQPVGGINEKIEGFFSVCKTRGLNGSHGVIIPSRNIKHLMLKDEVIEAVSKGKFTIYAIDRVEEGLEILTNMKVGTLSQDGSYDDGSLYRLIQQRLEAFCKVIDKKEDTKTAEANNPNNETNH